MSPRGGFKGSTQVVAAAGVDPVGIIITRVTADLWPNASAAGQRYLTAARRRGDERRPRRLPFVLGTVYGGVGFLQITRLFRAHSHDRRRPRVRGIGVMPAGRRFPGEPAV